MTITLEVVRQLREKTGAGVTDCKEALEESGGDLNKAIDVLRKKGIDTARKKVGRATKEGCIESYIHPGNKIGVMIEINCETDFVARNEDFRKFVKDLLLQITASNPLYISKKDVPDDLINKEKEMLSAQIKDKPANVVEKIVSGRLEKFYQDICLLEQPFVKDPSITVNSYLTSIIARTGENIIIRRFVRYQLGEET